MKETEKFIQYLKDHPEYRLYQAMRNFIQDTRDKKWNWLYVSDGKDIEDTFYWEEYQNINNLTCPKCGKTIDNKDLKHWKCVKCGANFKITL